MLIPRHWFPKLDTVKIGQVIVYFFAAILILWVVTAIIEKVVE
jgi:hypothetical protein